MVTPCKVVRRLLASVVVDSIFLRGALFGMGITSTPPSRLTFFFPLALARGFDPVCLSSIARLAGVRGFPGGFPGGSGELGRGGAGGATVGSTTAAPGAVVGASTAGAAIGGAAFGGAAFGGGRVGGLTTPEFQGATLFVLSIFRALLYSSNSRCCFLMTSSVWFLIIFSG